MARAALGLSTRAVAIKIGKSHSAIALFEKGSPKVSIAIPRALEDLYRSQYIYFGPKDGVSYRPKGEPIFILRARDIHAADAIHSYGSRCKNPKHQEIVKSRWKQFMDWRNDNPDRMKEPDTTTGG